LSCCIGELLTAYWCFLEFLFSASTIGIVFLTTVVLDAPWPNEFWRIGKELGLKNNLGRNPKSPILKTLTFCILF
jgi:hypothetical protein